MTQSAEPSFDCVPWIKLLDLEETNLSENFRLCLKLWSLGIKKWSKSDKVVKSDKFTIEQISVAIVFFDLIWSKANNLAKKKIIPLIISQFGSFSQEIIGIKQAQIVKMTLRTTFYLAKTLITFYRDNRFQSTRPETKPDNKPHNACFLFFRFSTLIKSYSEKKVEFITFFSRWSEQLKILFEGGF